MSRRFSAFHFRTPGLHPLSGDLEETNNQAPALPALGSVIFGKRAQSLGSLNQLRAFSTSARYLQVPPTHRETLWFSTIFVRIVGEHECHTIPPRTLTGVRQRKAADIAQPRCIVERLGLVRSCVPPPSSKSYCHLTLKPRQRCDQAKPHCGQCIEGIYACTYDYGEHTSRKSALAKGSACLNCRSVVATPRHWLTAECRSPTWD